MRNLEFHKRDDTYRYLNRTICRYKQEFVYVEVLPPYAAAPGDPVCEIFVKPFNGKKQRILCTDDDFSIHMPEIGYINTGEGSFYVKRKQERVQRTGLPLDMVIYHGRYPPSGSFYLAQPEGYKMLRNEYPTFKECVDAVSWDGVKSMAFHKHLCLVMPNRYSKTIEYKGDVAAVQDPRLLEWYIPQPRQDTSFIKAILVRNGVDLK